ncbi:MAG: hypothetical protein M3040_03540 [Bacteroidota bacterium]|nr:hypothetical protein [Bacteroidota bacterium]
MRILSAIILAIILYSPCALSQSAAVSRQLFFSDDKVIEVTLSTDVRKLKSEKKEPTWQPANIIMRFDDTSVIDENIRIEPRGEYRKNNCDIASLMLNLKNPTSPKLSALKKLKMVGGCRTGSAFEELLLKEYLVYKIYSLISIMSFRVRLMHVTYKDSRQKAKPYSQYAFLIEDITDLAARNNCNEMKKVQFPSEATNRQQMTLISLFQYMIGNTDWSVPNYHNIKLIIPKNDSLALPFAIPYDFDYAGLVDADYAVPNEELGIKSVKDRLYRGFERSMDELQVAIDIFKERKSRIMFTINSFTLLSEKTRKEMVNYLEEFYKTIGDKRAIRTAFIVNARKN